MTGSGATSKGPRRLALLVIAVVAFGAYALSPAIGGPSQLTLKRAKELFFTKLQSNTRFYSKAVADARFLVALLDDPDPTVRAAALDAVGPDDACTPEVVGRVVAAIQSPRTTGNATAALRRLGDSAVPLLSAAVARNGAARPARNRYPAVSARHPVTVKPC